MPSKLDFDPYNSGTNSGGLDFDPYSEPTQATPAAPAIARPDRSWVQAATDTYKGVATGVGNVISGAGTLYGLATGDMDNAATRFGGSVRDYWQERQSDALKADKAARSAAIDQADGILGKAGTAIKETIKNPSLLADTVAENIATFIPAAGAARVGSIASKAAGATAATAARVGTGAGIGVGAVQQGADVAQGAYDAAIAKPDAVWNTNAEYAKRVAAGESPDAVKHSMALESARIAMPAAAAVSVATQFLPGASMAERFAAGATAKAAKVGGKEVGGLAGRAVNAAKGVAGEGAQEALEEGGGQFAANLTNRNIDQNQSLSEGVGESAGMGFVGGAGLGGIAGAAQRPRVIDDVLKQEGVQKPVQPPSQNAGTSGASTDTSEQPSGVAEPLGGDIPVAGSATVAQPATLLDGSPVPDPSAGPLSRSVNVGVESGAVPVADPFDMTDFGATTSTGMPPDGFERLGMVAQGLGLDPDAIVAAARADMGDDTTLDTLDDRILATYAQSLGAANGSAQEVAGPVPQRSELAPVGGALDAPAVASAGQDQAGSGAAEATGLPATTAGREAAGADDVGGAQAQGLSRDNPLPESEVDRAPVGAWVAGPSIPGVADADTVRQVQDVPIDQIDATEFTSDGKLVADKQADATRYAEAMRNGDQFPNARGSVLPNGKIKLQDGHRRLAAAMEAGATTLRVAVNPMPATAAQAPQGSASQVSAEGQSAGAPGSATPAEVDAPAPNPTSPASPLAQAPTQESAASVPSPQGTPVDAGGQRDPDNWIGADKAFVKDAPQYGPVFGDSGAIAAVQAAPAGATVLETVRRPSGPDFIRLFVSAGNGDYDTVVIRDRNKPLADYVAEAAKEANDRAPSRAWAKADRDGMPEDLAAIKAAVADAGGANTALNDTNKSNAAIAAEIAKKLGIPNDKALESNVYEARQRVIRESEAKADADARATFKVGESVGRFEIVVDGKRRAFSSATIEENDGGWIKLTATMVGGKKGGVTMTVRPSALRRQLDAHAKTRSAKSEPASAPAPQAAATPEPQANAGGQGGEAGVNESFIRKLTSAERSSQREKNRGWQAIPKSPDGREVVFKPRGEQGPGFYYAAAPLNPEPKAEVKEESKATAKPKPRSQMTAKELREAEKAKKPEPASNPLAKYDAAAQEYGRSIRNDGAILKDGKESGLFVREKGKRLRIEDKDGKLTFSGAPTGEALGKFMESFWFAQKIPARPQQTEPVAQKAGVKPDDSAPSQQQADPKPEPKPAAQAASEVLESVEEVEAPPRRKRGEPMPAAERDANFRRWSNDAPLVTSGDAMSQDFKSGKKVVVEAFHGAKRPDRIGKGFNAKRATSGPMPYFTSSPDIAGGYATGKADTSLSYEDQEYATWFKVKLPGERSARPLDSAWYGLPREVQQRIADTLPHVVNVDENNDEMDGYRLGDDGEYGLAGRSHWEYEIRQARGNVLKAAKEIWLNGGNLVNSEQDFMEILRLGGMPMDMVTFDSPFAEYPSTFPVFVNMQRPLVTNDIPQRVVDALNNAAKRDRSRSNQYGADAWDKNTMTLREWVSAFNADGRDNAYVWTSIPDKVTNVFRDFGYDGIIDMGGKGGGANHRVYIPFTEGQVKGKFNKGNFDESKRDLLESVEDTGFYSAALRAVEEGKGAPKRGTYGDWRGWLDGAVRRGDMKQSERDWLGIDAFLSGRDTTTRQELADFIRANEVKVEEVTLGEDGAVEAEVEAWWNDEGGANEETPYGELSASERREARERYRDEVSEFAENGPDTKFAQYQLPGGENYRELLLTLPQNEPATTKWMVFFPNGNPRQVVDTEQEAKREASAIGGRYEKVSPKDTSGTYRSSHFDQPNILAHVRFNERVDSEGRRVLFLEELQSDWAQSIRKQGLGADPEVVEKDGKFMVRDRNSGEFVSSEFGPMTFSDRRFAQQQADSMKGRGLPNMPFKATDEWAMLAFKRMVRHAAENGFDRIAWTTGTQQAERYDLSKQIDSVTYDPLNKRLVATKDRQRVLDETVPPEKLDDYIGKDVASKLLSDDTLNGAGNHVLSGLDLRTGGSGMRGFYDKILPSAVNKWAKRFGGKVGQTRIVGSDALQAEQDYRTGGWVVTGPKGNVVSTHRNRYEAEAAAKNAGPTQHSIDLTPAMRDAALQGMPLFQQEAQELSDADLTPAERASRERQSIDRKGLREQLSRQHGNADADALGLRDAVTKALGESGNKVVYLRGIEGLPENVRGPQQRMQSQRGSNMRTAGLFHPATGTVYLFTDVVKSPQIAAFTASHEIAGHQGLRALLGDKLNQVLDLAEQNPTVKAVAASMTRQRKLRGDQRYLAVEEALADLAAANRTGNWKRIADKHGVEVPVTMRSKVAAMLQNVVRRIKALFGKRGVEFTDAQVLNLLENAWQAAQGNQASMSVMGADGALEQVVFHGTPHTVDRFSLQKIGTGEGAQAYGWGLYFASAKDIAKHYQEALTKQEALTVRVGGKIVAQGDAITETELKAIDLLERGERDAGQFKHNRAYYAKRLTSDPEVLALIDQWKDSRITYERPKGNLYRVDVPEDSDLLDWDKPLSEQPEKVQEALKPVRALGGFGVVKASVIYTELQKPYQAEKLGIDLGSNPQKAVSEYLNSLGIPGLRYLDGNSRANGEGSANYVIWDESAIGTPESALESTEDQTQDNPSILESVEGFELSDNPTAADVRIPGEINLSALHKGGFKAAMERIGQKFTSLKPKVLALIPLQELDDFSPKRVDKDGKAESLTPAVGQYIKLQNDMQAFRNGLYVEYDKVAQDLQAFASEGTGFRGWMGNRVSQQGRDLFALMHDSTVAGIDPSEVGTRFKEPEKAAKYRELQERYNALPEKGRELFKATRDAYAKQTDLLDEVLEGNVKRTAEITINRARRRLEAREKEIDEDGGMSAAEKKKARDAARAAYDDTVKEGNVQSKMAALRSMLEKNRVPKPYFPLKRDGEYWVSVLKDGKLASFSKFQNAEEQQAYSKEMTALGYETRLKYERDGSAKTSAMIDPTFVAEVEGILAGLPNEIRDEVWQAYLERMPDMSLRKSFIHRKNVPGYHFDALKAFASSMFHSSYQLSRLKYGVEMQEALDVLGEQANSLRDKDADAALSADMIRGELKERHAFIMNPTNARWAQTVTGAAFLYSLGANPAHLFLNATQTIMLGLPVMGSRYGFKRATAALGKAMHDFAKGKGHLEKANLSADERRAFTEMQASGIIEKSQAHDMAGIGAEGVEYSAVRKKVMDKIGWFMHQSERFNREVTAIAGYRLARADGKSHDAAVAAAEKMVYTIHFDYSNSGRARIMQGDLAKALLVFRNYQANMIYRLFRDIHQSIRGESVQVKREARKQLGAIFGMYAFFAGAMGVPFYGLAMALAGLGDDDDDPVTAEQQFVNGTVEFLGPTAASILLRGLPGTAFDIDLTERVGMGNLWFRSPNQEMEGRDAYHYWMEQLLGAGLGPVTGVVDAAILARQGQFQRAVERMAPAALRNPMQAIRQAQEGGVTSLDGDLIKETTGGDLISKALGFQPLSVSEQYDKNSNLKNADRRLSNRREKLLNRYFLAIQMGDDTAEVMADVQAFNLKNPEYAITRDTFKRSARLRNRNKLQSENGIVMTRRMRRLQERMSSGEEAADE